MFSTISHNSRSSDAIDRLWGRLLHQDSDTQRQPHGNLTKGPPIVPTDKAGTSVRILLHDTRANLEEFSTRVHKLTDSIDETKREISTIQKLFQSDHETTIEQVVGVVNRCQIEIQRSIGSPAQAADVEGLRTEVSQIDRQIEALEKKIEVLTLMNQTQIQALQTLQEQQGQMSTMLAPLLPLLQAVPLHLESAKSNFMENLKHFEQNQNRQINSLLARSQSSTESRSRSLGSVALYNTPSSSPILVPQKRRSQRVPQARLSINPEVSLDLQSPTTPVHESSGLQSGGGIAPYTDTPASPLKRFRENDSRATPHPVTPPMHADQDDSFPLAPTSSMNSSSLPHHPVAHPFFSSPVNMETPIQRHSGANVHRPVTAIDLPLERGIAPAYTKPMSLKERRENLINHVVSEGKRYILLDDNDDESSD